MCKNCGCSEPHHHDAHGSHVHIGADGKPYRHTHEDKKVVTLKTAVLAENDAQAESNRKFFRERGIVALNLISSPGSGKTTLLEKTLELLKAENIRAAVITGDQYGDYDAMRLSRSGAPVTQIETHDSCHLNAAQVGAVLESAVPEGTQIVFIENVGNLVCPVAFDLGEDHKIILLSTPEGEEKPLKYPGAFAAATVIILTKLDLADVLEWNRTFCLSNIRKINPGAEVIEVSARKTTGLGGWMDYLKKNMHQALN